jgi:Tol biopolymer transport system component
MAAVQPAAGEVLPTRNRCRAPWVAGGKCADAKVEGMMAMIHKLPVSLVVWAAILATGASPAFGAFPGANGKIAFVSDRLGADFDIWTMNPEGRALVNLTANSRADDFAPNWRADGGKVAFMSDRVSATNPEGDHEIFVMNPDGSDKTQITFNAFDDEDPVWSPNGRRIAFTRDFDPVRGQFDDDLFTMRADGSREHRVTQSPGVQDLQAEWSPDGHTFAFLSDRDGDLELYTMDADGYNVQQLTFNDAFEFRPNWSPDGKAIVYTSDRDANFELYAISRDGTTDTRLTFNDAGDGYPAWAPDGSEIVFGSDRAGVRGGSDLFTMRVDGSEQVNRTLFPGLDIQPDWQPVP